MTLHRLTNIAIFLGIICVVLAMTALDYNDFENDAQKEHREWMQAVQFCHRSYGPQTAPEYTDDGRLVCVGRKGQRYSQVML